MKVHLGAGPVRKTGGGVHSHSQSHSQQQVNADTSDPRPRPRSNVTASSARPRRGSGSIAKGRSLSLTEDVLGLQQEEDAQTMGFLQGARVHLPIITEDNQAQEATGPETGTTQYLAQERKLMLPSLSMGAKMRTARRTSVPVEMEISGAGTTQPLPSKIPISNKKYLRWQGKFDVLPGVGDRTQEVCPDDEPILTNKDQLRHILKCHSMGVPMRISKQDYATGHYARPLFHCHRCMDQWEKLGRLPKKCTQPNEEGSGQEIYVGSTALNYLKKIWGNHLSDRSNQPLAEQAGEIRSLKKSAMRKESDHTSGSESEENVSSYSDSEFTSVTDLSDDARHHRERSKRTAKASRKSKRHTKTHKETVRSSHGDITRSHHGVNVKRSRHQKHIKKDRRHKGGDVSASSDDWSYDTETPQVSKHDVGSGGSKHGITHKKKHHSKNKRKHRKRDKDLDGNLTGSEDEEMGEGKLVHDEVHRKHRRKKTRHSRGKRKSERGHQDETEGSEERTESEDEDTDEGDSCHDYEKLGHAKTRRSCLRRARKKRQGEASGESEQETSERESLEREDSLHSGGHHHKKRRSKGKRKSKKGKHAEEEEESEELTGDEDGGLEQDSWYDKESTNLEGRRRRSKKKELKHRKTADKTEENRELDDSEYGSPDVQGSWHDSYIKSGRKKSTKSKTEKKTKRGNHAEKRAEGIELTDDEYESIEEADVKDGHGKARKVKIKRRPGKETHAELGGDREISTGTDSQGSSEREDSQHVVTVGSHHRRNSHAKKKRHSKARQKSKKGRNKYDGSLDRIKTNKSDSEVLYLPGRIQRDELEESSSYEELLIRLIDDFEDESFHHLKDNPLEGSGSRSTGSKKVKSLEKSPNKHHATRRHSTQHGPGTQAQTTHSSQVTSGPKDNLEGASTPDLYSRHARRKSQDVSSHFAATLPAGPGQGVVKSKRSEKKSKKPIIRNLMVKDRTGKPSTQAGHLKETVLKTTSSDSTSTITERRPSVDEQASSDTVHLDHAEAELAAGQKGGRRASVDVTGGRTSRTGSIPTLQKPSHQALDPSLVDSVAGPGEGQTKGSGPQTDSTKRVRRASKTVTDRSSRVGDTYHSKPIEDEQQDPKKTRRASQIPRTTSSVLNTWASDETPGFRMKVGSRPPSSVVQSCVTREPADESTVDGTPLPKLKDPSVSKLPQRSGPDTAKNTVEKPVAEVKPNILPKLEVKSEESLASSKSSSSSSGEEYEEDHKPCKHLVIPDFGGISSLSFTPAFTFSFYPRLIWPQQMQGGPREGSGEKTKNDQAECTSPKVIEKKLNLETARKSKTDVKKLAIRMQHIVSKRNPIAKFVKKPPPKKDRPPRKSVHGVSSSKMKSAHSSPKKKSSSRSRSTSPIKMSVRSSRKLKTNSVLASCSHVTIGESDPERPEGSSSGFKIEVCPNNLHEAESVLIQIRDYI